MSEEKRSSTTVFIIAGAAIGLCCVSSLAGMLLFGIGSPMALLRGQAPVSIDMPTAPAEPGDSVLTGAWSQGNSGITELGDRNAAGWSALRNEGRRYVFRSNHSCETETLTRNTNGDCTTW